MSLLEKIENLLTNLISNNKIKIYNDDGNIKITCSKNDLIKIDLIARPEKKVGMIDNFHMGLSIGNGVANNLEIGIDQSLRLISPDGLKTIFGTTPRIGDFPVKYIFKVGRYDIDRYRLYMPL